jgi:hypothetical protein
MVKFFEDNDRLNWVDSNNVFVGFSNWQDCCEEWGGGYWSSLSKDAVRVDLDEENNNYVFDTSFYIEDFSWEEDYDRDVYRAAFKLSNGKKDIFLIIWNEHNGYYAHGFQFCNGDTVIVKGSI